MHIHSRVVTEAMYCSSVYQGQLLEHRALRLSSQDAKYLFICNIYIWPTGLENIYSQASDSTTYLYSFSLFLE